MVPFLAVDAGHTAMQLRGYELVYARHRFTYPRPVSYATACSGAITLADRRLLCI